METMRKEAAPGAPGLSLVWLRAPSRQMGQGLTSPLSKEATALWDL